MITKLVTAMAIVNTINFCNTLSVAIAVVIAIYYQQSFKVPIQQKYILGQ